jgi:hypothetical protein
MMMIIIIIIIIIIASRARSLTYKMDNRIKTKTKS